ncbi:MAG: fused MFS/spermidine synthase [Ignavibacteriae bacterium]|nr:fused MFS/spermidine synthase [Ignavibacteriota bacterium]
MNKKTSTVFIALLFFFSGTAGLMYEIVWTRMLVLVFGNTTHSIVAVVAAFLAGLALGSFMFGRWTDLLSSRRLLRLYGLLELGVGLSALGSKFIIENISQLYISLAGEPGSVPAILLIKFAVASLALLIPTILMGATLPALVSFIELRYRDAAKNISLLYAINTFGGILGVLAAGLVLIELVGIHGTLYTAIGVNVLVGGVAWLLAGDDVQPTIAPSSGQAPAIRRKEAILLAMYALSGLTAIGYQVLWTRLLTPRVDTVIYAFASILAVYLLGIALGSLLYHRFLTGVRSRWRLFSFSQLAIGMCAVVSVFLVSTSVDIARPLVLLGVILPATVLMGVSFPLVVVLVNGDDRAGKNVGVVYASNSAGSIAGAFIASFILLPMLGTAHSIILLALANILIALAVSVLEVSTGAQLFRKAYPVLVLAALIGGVVLFQSGREQFHDGATRRLISSVSDGRGEWRILEDEVASVFAAKSNGHINATLKIDGVATTMKVAETRFMAHLPIALHKNPERMLVIAFGMGSTFRSALKHGLQVDVVELVPSVPQVFDLFHDDAESVLSDPNGRVIINDGRNYVLTTGEQYDLVTIDPPPPFNAAGTTVLYAQEFYRQIIPRLREGGLVCQWMWFGSREDDVAMAMKSFTDVFEHVAVFGSFWDTPGVFMFGSQSPIVIDSSRVQEIFTSNAVVKDFQEVHEGVPPKKVFTSYLADREMMQRALSDFPSVTDNHPCTEYYLLRHMFSERPRMTIDWLQTRLQQNE